MNNNAKNLKVDRFPVRSILFYNRHLIKCLLLSCRPGANLKAKAVWNSEGVHGSNGKQETVQPLVTLNRRRTGP